MATGAIPALAEGAERLAQKGVQKLETSSVGRGILNMTGNQEWELSLHPGGEAAKAMHLEYIRLHDQALDQETAKVQAIRDWHASDASARAAVPVRTGTMSQYHAHAVATGHPIQAVTGRLVADPETAHLTQEALMRTNEQKARLSGLAGSYGSNYENLAPILAGMRRSADPDIVQNAGRIADIVSNQTRDTAHIQRIDKSAAKYNMNMAMISANKVYEDADEPTAKLFKENPTYEKVSEGERKAHKLVDTVMLPFLSIKHVGQFFNLPQVSPLASIGKGLLRMDSARMNQVIDASHTVAGTLWSTMYHDIQAESGKVAQWTGQPTLARILGRVTHQPGFSWLRKQQLNMAGAVGFHSTIDWAHDLVHSGSKIAEARLRELQIDPADVIKQGGKLTDEQLMKGVYHYTNNTMFFNKGLDTSLWQNRNVFARSVFMYHSFVGSQTAFMRKNLMTLAKAGDYKGLAQMAGTVAILFPNVAPLLAGAEKILQTGSLQQGEDETKQRYSRLYHPKSVSDWAENYITLLSHIGAAGVYFNYINAIKGHRFSSALAGPILGAVATDTEDVYGAIAGDTAASKKPLERDFLRQGVPVIGGALSHIVAPTKTETSGPSRKRFGSAYGRRFGRGRRF
jgi:hypothetical protein